MYLHPALLLLLLLMYAFTPAMQDWVLADGTAWYRPWLAWLLVIAVIAWMNRRRNDHGH